MATGLINSQMGIMNPNDMHASVQPATVQTAAPSMNYQPFQDSGFMDRLWSQVNHGGSMSVSQGEAAQRGMYVRNQKMMEQNSFLPPGFTREGLINQARQSMPQAYAPYIASQDPNYKPIPGDGIGSDQPAQPAQPAQGGHPVGHNLNSREESTRRIREKLLEGGGN
jgi:hypothetical protein